MRQLFLAAALFSTGCTNFVGPFDYRTPQRVDDPSLTISQQQARGRDRLALPEQSTYVAPRTYADFLGPNGR